MFRAWGLGLRVEGLGVRVWVLGLRVEGCKFRGVHVQASFLLSCSRFYICEFLKTAPLGISCSWPLCKPHMTAELQTARQLQT